MARPISEGCGVVHVPAAHISGSDPLVRLVEPYIERRDLLVHPINSPAVNGALKAS
jgi:hypothetical protein